jgi:SGNH domain (fused to AT3 domains)
MSEMVTTIRQMGSKVLVIGPIPKPQTTVYDCLSQHLNDATACTEPVSVGINEAGLASEQATVGAAGGDYLNVQPWFCTAQTCAAIVDNLLVWRDDNHISEPYSAFLGPAMSAEISGVVGGA